MMNGHGKSDRPVVPAKPANNAGPPAAEGMEGRGPASGNRRASHTHRTPCRIIRVPPALAPIRRKELEVVHVVPFLTSLPEAGAGCGNSARPDLCGGRAERPVPTATFQIHNPHDPNIRPGSFLGEGQSHSAWKKNSNFAAETAQVSFLQQFSVNIAILKALRFDTPTRPLHRPASRHDLRSLKSADRRRDR